MDDVFGKSILISCGARLAVFDIAELREVTAYDELELDTLGDRKTALFLIMSDTDDSFNFLISMCYTQLFKRKSKTTAQKYINFVEALAIYLLVAYFPLPSSILTIETAVLTASGRVALGVLFACLFLWITEPVPFHITGFLGVLLMLLLKVDSFATLIKQGFGSETIVFFIGVLTLSAMITRSGLSSGILTLVIYSIGLLSGIY